VQYEYNNEFNVLQGGKYFENGRLDFGSPKRAMYDTFYRTIFGPSVSHAFVTYERSDASLSNALSRLCKVRAPERAGFHQQLRLNQAQFIQNLRVQGVVKQIHTLFHLIFQHLPLLMKKPRIIMPIHMTSKNFAFKLVWRQHSLENDL